MAERPPSTRPNMWFRTHKPAYGWPPVILVALWLALAVTIVGGYRLHWAWTGYGIKDTSDSVWDWLKLVLFPTTLLLLPLWLRSRERRRKGWRVVFAVLALTFAVLVVGGYRLHWGWTGFSDNKLWDWLGLFFMPFALPLAILWATTPADSMAQPDVRGLLNQPRQRHQEAAEPTGEALASLAIEGSASSTAGPSAVIDLGQLLRHPDPDVRLASRQLLESLASERRTPSTGAGTALRSDAAATEAQRDREKPLAQEAPEGLPADGGVSSQALGPLGGAHTSLAPARSVRPHPALATIIAAAAIGLLIVGALVIPNVSHRPAPKVPGSLTVTGSALALARVVEVPGTREWTDTGIYLLKGEQVTINASGQVQHNASQPGSAVGPDGDRDRALAKYSILRSAKHAALIGMIMSSAGRPFLVGSSYHTDIDDNGLLLLRVNDKDVSNNRGKFIAHIQVAKP